MTDMYSSEDPDSDEIGNEIGDEIQFDMDCRVMVFGIHPYAADIRMPSNTAGEISKSAVAAWIQNAKQLPLPQGLSGCFVRKQFQGHTFLFFKYITHVGCSNVKSKTHKKLSYSSPAAINIHNFYENIGVGNSFISAKEATTMPWQVHDDGKLCQILSMPVPIDDPTDVKEAQRTDALLSTLWEYVEKNSVPVKILCGGHLNDRKDFSEFSGGGDIQLYGKNGSVFIQREEQEEEAKWNFVASCSIEDKIQQVPIEGILKQLQANMLLCMTTVWFNGVVSCNQSDIQNYVYTSKIVSYGLTIALGKPIVMYQADMNFKPNFCN